MNTEQKFPPTQQPAAVFLRHIWRLLTEPAAAVQPETTRQWVRLVSILLLSEMVISSAAIGLRILHEPGFSSIPGSISILLLMLLAYALARTRFYRWGIWLLIVVLYAYVYIVALVPTSFSADQILYYLVTVVLLGSLLFSVRTIALLALFSVVSVILLPQVSGRFVLPPQAAAVYTLLMSVLILAGAVARTRDHMHIEEQSRDLAESEDRYRSMLEATFEAVLIHDDGRVIDANQVFERMFGHSQKSVVGCSILDFFQPESHAVLQENWQHLAAASHEVVARRSDGTLFDAELFAKAHVIRGRDVYVVAIRDISERKRAERTRRDNELQYRALFEQSHDAVFILDLEGRLQTMNKQAGQMLGYTPEELIGKPLNAVVPPHEIAKSYHVRDRLLAGERIPVYERIFRRKNGEEFSVEVNVALVRDADGRPRHIQSIVRDISERKRADKQKLQLALERERVKVLQQFINDASHDFRTPLSNMKTSLFLLKRSTDPEKQKEHLDLLDMQIGRLQRLLADLLTMSSLERIATGQFRLGRVSINLLAREVLASRQEMADSKQIDITLDLAEGDLPVLADKVQLGLALNNIVENALLYTPENGHMTVQTRTENGIVLITISDTGIGITPEDLPRIFDSFFRADRARNADTGGTGLGLPIALKIVEAHNGNIEVESVLDQGSSFTIRLPSMPDLSADSAAAQADEPDPAAE